MHSIAASVVSSLACRSMTAGKATASVRRLSRDLEGRALALGGVTLSGDALRTNDVMIALARKAGFTIKPHADDWTLVRFEKGLSGVVAHSVGADLHVVGREPQVPTSEIN
ncbi:hypothetical protein ACRAVF_13310 [Bradyrhizobium oligotrophicum S58]